MPQMAPLNWLTLMIFFITMMILFNIQNFYSFNYKTQQKSLLKKMEKINWKW